MGIETAIIASAVVLGAAAVTSAGMAAKASSDEKDAQASMAASAAARAAEIDKAAKEAEVQAAEQAKLDAQKRLRAKTQTIFTSPLGIKDESDTVIGKTTLGSS